MKFEPPILIVYKVYVVVQLYLCLKFIFLPLCLGKVIQDRGPARGGGPMSPVWISKRLLSVFINACRLLALPSLSQFGRERLSLVTISFYALSLLFGPCRLSEFTLAGPQDNEFETKENKFKPTIRINYNIDMQPQVTEAPNMKTVGTVA